MAIQHRALIESELGKGDIVIGKSADFSRSGGGKITSELKHDEACTFAALEFFLFGVKCRFGIDPSLAGSINLLEAGVGNGNIIFDSDHDALLELAQLQLDLFLARFG